MRPEERYVYHEFKDFKFHYVDYIVFGLMILMSTGTGIFFGYIKRRKFSQQSLMNLESHTNFGSKKMQEYLLGSKKLKIFPVAMSLVASYISGVTMLGTPSEIYYYGTQYWMIVIPIVFMGLTVATVYLPVFCKLRVGSSYEYLELRFSSTIRNIASFMFVMDEIFFLPIIIYVPAISFNQVSGLDVYLVSAIICVACVFYTIVGGIKAVVHTDAWQILVMFLSMLVVVILGTYFSGGPGPIFQTAAEGSRLKFFDMSTSLYQRQTFWGVMFGGYFYWTSFNSVNQTMVQRYMSLPTLRKAQKSIAIFILGTILFLSACCYTGLLIYDFYEYCDPKSANLIQNDDQLLPIYVMQTAGHLHGIPGLFIAGVFGAALSSLSVVLNSTSLVFHEDILKGCFKLQLSERISNIIIKGSIAFLGTVALSLVFVLEHLSGILSVATSVTAIAAGTTAGLFTLGMLVPWSNNKGALVGAICGALMSAWISFGSQIVMALNLVSPTKLDISVERCPTNITLPEIDHSHESDIFPLYRLSFHWINPIGLFTTILVGTVVSFLTGSTDLKELNADLISPVMQRFLPKKNVKRSSEDNSIQNTTIGQSLTSF